MGRKIDSIFENPIDNFLYKYGIEKQHDFLYKLNITPNIITTLSLLIGLLSIYYFEKEKFNISATLFFFSYYLDCMDGYFARTYNQVTKLGDIYDHASDMIKHLTLFFYMYKKDKTKFLKVVGILIIPIILTFIHLGCQQLFYKNNSSFEILNLFCFACPNKNFIHFTKYFGSGTFETIIILCIIFWNKL